ncbi:hypothetical protein EN851_34750, partial [Mesorhizobium sp. M8A.F.Ca.ET.208.01.1.1]|uniref:membrane dipeptidase n=1 Tax=Mesorhizobium sp. M8A.F.Ca.ET.208.01.1.1 TaxID=2563969 RepID=UPI00113C5B8D
MRLAGGGLVEQDHGGTRRDDAGDIEQARATNRTAIFLGLQNPLPIEDDIGLIEMLYDLGIRFMQLT